MKRPIYTTNVAAETLRNITATPGRLTAEEHSYLVQAEQGAAFASREALIRSYLNTDSAKLTALAQVIDLTREFGSRNILSLGAGPCVLEHLLKLALPAEARIVATDFDPFFIAKAKEFYPNIIPATFDFFKDDVASLAKNLDAEFDLAIFFGSAYVMDDDQFIRLFRGLAGMGVARVVDFHAGFMNWRGVISNLPIIQSLRTWPWLRRARGLPAASQETGKFHGYSRSRSELRRLYRAGGFSSIREIRGTAYEYAALLAP